MYDKGELCQLVLSLNKRFIMEKLRDDKVETCEPLNCNIHTVMELESL